ncbi:MAG: DUF3341 domain-containing protein [Pyrinomonadaceae bacterium]|nr:DUF3341 domain-containing protein [Pyrinomonadaceae bacterium]
MRNTNNELQRYTAAYFSNEDDLKGSTAEARLRGFTIHDVFSPFPVHGMDEAMGLKPSRITWAAFAGGLAGLVTAVVLQIWTSAYDWALNIGGKPFNTPLLFVPVSFELTVLFSGLTSVIVLFYLSGLNPFSKRKSLPGVNDDKFVLVLDHSGASFRKEAADEIFSKYNAEKVVEGDLV